MGKQKVGLYFGVNSVGVVVSEKNTIKALSRFELSALEEEAKVETLNEEIRWEALINRSLREAGVEEKEVYVSMTDKDFIFRPIEMPLMRKQEIESSLSYEVEKYIPFKLEELQWDYGYTKFPKEKKATVSFVGIKEANLTRVQEILGRLEINPIVIEPSCLSLVRVLKADKRFSKLRNFAVLDFTENEGYITFYYHELPVFNRYLAIPKAGDEIDLEKFIESIRISFNYFQREFTSYEMEKFIVVGNYRDENLISFLQEELQANVELVTPYDLTGNAHAEGENLKAMGVAGIDSYSYKFKPVLRRSDEYSLTTDVIRQVPLKLGMIAFVLILGLVAGVGVKLFSNYKLGQAREHIQLVQARIKTPQALRGLDSAAISSQVSHLRSDISTLRGLHTGSKDIAPFFEQLSNLLPQGVWLDSLNVSYRSGSVSSSGSKEGAKQKYTVSVRGFVFLGDDHKERTAIDAFISNLRDDTVVKELFPEVELVSSRRTAKSSFEVISFQLTLK